MEHLLPMPNLSPKWKEVLGFDISSPRQEKYLKTPTLHRHQDFYQLTANDVLTTPSVSSANLLSYPSFPREIIFFHRKNEILISAPPSSSSSSFSPTFSTPRSLFCITLGTEIPSHTGRPDITLHAGADKSSMVICFAKFNSLSPIVQMTLCPPPKKSISANFSSEDLTAPLPVSSIQPATHNARSKHTKSSSICTTPSFRSIQTKKSRGPPLSQFRIERLVHVFDPHLASYKYVFSYGREAFEWRRIKPLIHHHNHSYQQQYRSRSSSAAGETMKLIRASTGEVLVVYRQIAASHNWESEANVATAMMRFRRTENMDQFAEDFDIFVVVSLVSIIEKERREQRQPCSHS
ncbi:putative alternative oxidase [Golovinomyces cichoracearum]|uniref:Putative alternative oxidase n=1 Tax=Golovinomyces cichoracearum TaxID=62708 RepID=A0A420ILE4_9PEZI|nr:putative alternative oxidase [Golovinomyces cichoracearum]